jgi:hypothetical protein
VPFLSQWLTSFGKAWFHYHMPISRASCTHSPDLTYRDSTTWPGLASLLGGCPANGDSACGELKPSECLGWGGAVFNVKAQTQTTSSLTPLCALMVAPVGGGWEGWSRCTGQRCPAPVPARSCWPMVWQAFLIQGVSHVQCPPRQPLSPPAWC